MRKFGDVRIDALRFFGANVRIVRLARQRDAEQLAEEVGLDPGVLTMIESACDVELTVATAAELAFALGVPLARLFEEPEQEFLDP